MENLEAPEVNRDSRIKNLQNAILHYEHFLLELNKMLFEEMYGSEGVGAATLVVTEAKPVTKKGLIPITLQYERWSMGGGELKSYLPEWYGAKAGDVFHPILVRADYRYNMD